MRKTAVGILLALTIGVSCRLAGVPVPAPQALSGAVLVLAMTLGYLATDRLNRRRPLRHDRARGEPTEPADRTERGR
ncbi:hypothetical protein BH24PSE2_BH24PSE2_01590 [soil metagenome]